jgi:hypothetical protein
MNIKKTCVKTVSILLALEIILFTGCQNSSQQSTRSSSESEKLPADLTGLENNIETIVKTLDGPAVQVSQGSGSSQFGQSSSSQQESGSSQSAQSSSSQQESGSSQSAQSSSSQQGSQSSQQGQSQQSSGSSSSSQQDPMEKIAPIVENMHYQWNNLMSEAIKKGANNDLVNNFDNSLNNLSNTVNSKNKINIMMAANRLYAYIPDLYSLFQTKSSPQIKRVRYYSRDAILNASTANWKQADSDMNSLKSVWVLYKNSLSKDQQDLANKLDLSIYELEKVVKEKNQSLVNIKGKIELSNTQALEKATESESGGESSSSQSSEGSSSSQQSSGGQSSSQ